MIDKNITSMTYNFKVLVTQIFVPKLQYFKMHLNLILL